MEARLADEAGGDAVHAHAFRGELLGHRLRERDEPALGRGVGEGAGPASVVGGDGGYVDDRPPLPLDHGGRGGLADEEDARQVEVEHLPPERLRHLEERMPLHEVARVVDEDVDPPEPRERRGDEPARLLALREVRPEHRRFPSAGLDLARGLRGPRLVLVEVDGHVGPGGGERHRRRAADAPARARHQRHRVLVLRLHGFFSSECGQATTREANAGAMTSAAAPRRRGSVFWGTTMSSARPRVGSSERS